MDTPTILDIGREAATAVRSALSTLDDWGLAGTRPGQYRSDLAGDEAALEVLIGAGLGVLSEESGLHHEDRPLLAVVDPVDGSTNASRGIPWFATSICVLDNEGPLAAVVVNQANGQRFEAVRGEGASLDGHPIAHSGCRDLSSALVALSGYPHRHLGWKQYRALGAAALDLCAVATGAVDGYIDCIDMPEGGAHGVWDYLGGMLVCTEAGATVADRLGRELVVRDPRVKRTPIAAATPELFGAILAARSAT